MVRLIPTMAFVTILPEKAPLFKEPLCWQPLWSRGRYGRRCSKTVCPYQPHIPGTALYPAFLDVMVLRLNRWFWLWRYSMQANDRFPVGRQLRKECLRCFGFLKNDNIIKRKWVYVIQLWLCQNRQVTRRQQISAQIEEIPTIMPLLRGNNQISGVTIHIIYRIIFKKQLFEIPCMI